MAERVNPEGRLEPDPQVAAAAAALMEQAQGQEVGAPYGRDGNGVANVPGFASETLTPEPLLPGEGEAGTGFDEAPVTAQEAPSDTVSFEADLSGIEDLLADDEPEDEPEPEYEEPDPEDEFDVDQKQAKRLRQLEKRNRYLEEQYIRAGQKNWKAEAKRRFPLAAAGVDDINESSRKETLRRAKALHDTVAKAAAPYLKEINEARAAAEADGKAEGRQKAEEAWGKPTVGPPEPAIEHARLAEAEDSLDRRHYKSVLDRTLARVRAGKLNV